ncbi:MAG: TetR/AcrR family transcriptional regulator [Thermoanaerobacterales bacterium]|nr:TetR/AcrR family transcriptional regulator [Bacillota bacterium]MDI6907589.1 TetR/AcrR family transcriptional regulator [Thermoanaerobacterales bacterium]
MQTDIRERVLNAMEELVRVRGPAAVTTDELAARAGISKRTLYRYFRNKEAVLEGVIRRLMARIEARTEDVLQAELPPGEKLRGIVRVIVEHARVLEPLAFGNLPRMYPRLWAMVDEYRAERIGRLADVIARGGASGDFRPVHPQVAVAAVIAAVRAVLNPAFIMRHGLSLPQAFDELFGLFLYGLLARTPGAGNGGPRGG